jgi:hypothetical protein
VVTVGAAVGEVAGSGDAADVLTAVSVAEAEGVAELGLAGVVSAKAGIGVTNRSSATKSPLSNF